MSRLLDTARVANYGTTDEPRWVIEADTYNGWGVPAWDEVGLCDLLGYLDGAFETKQAAQAALDNAKEYSL